MFRDPHDSPFGHAEADKDTLAKPFSFPVIANRQLAFKKAAAQH